MVEVEQLEQKQQEKLANIEHLYKDIELTDASKHAVEIALAFQHTMLAFLSDFNSKTNKQCNPDFDIGDAAKNMVRLHVAETPSKAMYHHYLMCHTTELKAHFSNTEFSFFSWSTQRSEHCNKLFKLRMVNLFSRMRIKPNEKTPNIHRHAFALIMREELVRVLYFPRTILKEKKKR
jgi:hypothetical protein